MLSVFLLTLFAINCIHVIKVYRKFGNTLLVVFCKWDTSFTKLMDYLPVLNAANLQNTNFQPLSARFNQACYKLLVQLLSILCVNISDNFQTRYRRADSIGRLVNG